jgi:indole-3-glycerol phosphate synthase
MWDASWTGFAPFRWRHAVHRFLEEIIARRRRHIEELKRLAPAPALHVSSCSTPANPVPALREMAGFIIAEVKRRSPSKGAIAPDADAALLARAYERGGAAAVSVLCEPDFFGGSRTDVRRAAQAVAVPILCKDFILDPVQLQMARDDGASWVLLIARVLGPDLAAMVRAALQIGLEPLVETHDERELADAVSAGARLLGINARDLDTFEVDLELVRNLLPLCPAHCACVAESGLQSARDLCQMRQAGAHGFLAGETLMRSPDPENLLREWLGELHPVEALP